ncbi:hypothetical protein MA03_06960 [Infirmifilum uzonense]|uniref:Brix domain-containing protein n=1 Tax=Infirmifilum uzonense TaxID=1550241 RepID=A0A0F7FI70_9CREN|nr:hypothetical protein [Infirmifilum uzonense]AKG39030.1 hypothetical protein MA03_06960 [Infirmifilum uzonense]
MILVTTTRHATPPVRRLAKELAWVLGYARRINRGKMSMNEVALLAQSMRASRVIIVGRGLHGNPAGVSFLKISDDGTSEQILSLRLRGVVFSRVSNRPKTPETKLPVVSIGSSEEYGEDIALAFDTVYLGRYSLEDLRSFTSYSRVIAVERVESKGITLVLKFLEMGEPIGPKLLVRKIKTYF